MQSMAGAPVAADGSKGLGPLLAGWDGDLADAAPESQAQRAAPVTAGVDVLKILSACGQCVSTPALPLHASAFVSLEPILLRQHWVPGVTSWISGTAAWSQPFQPSRMCPVHAVLSSLGTGLKC